MSIVLLDELHAELEAWIRLGGLDPYEICQWRVPGDRVGYHWSDEHLELMRWAEDYSPSEERVTLCGIDLSAVRHTTTVHASKQSSRKIDMRMLCTPCLKEAMDRAKQ